MLQSPVPPQYVFWYHNARMINYDAARGVTVLTEPGPKTQSALAIRAAGPQHSGNYTCAAANTEPAHIYVYVSEGSQYTRMHTESAAELCVYAVQLTVLCCRRQDGGHAEPQHVRRAARGGARGGARARLPAARARRHMTLVHYNTYLISTLYIYNACIHTGPGK